MGGSSNANCKSTAQGLLIHGNLVEEGGGFISCRSEVFEPPINLDDYRGIEINLDGKGKQLKFAISANDIFFGIKSFIPNSLKWVYAFDTEINGSTKVKIPFNKFEANVRANKIIFPVKFNRRNIYRFQLLYSKFGLSGKFNSSFCPGQISILLRSISAYS
tara:strand:+ start:217 stop:699 length:483 start_codon:yes stop_codon:yes gene_type:complete